MIINLEKDGVIKQAKLGFSWTEFFFGALVPLVRGDWKWFIIIFAVGFITLGLSNIVFAFIYNRLYVKDLVYAGYRPYDDFSKAGLQSRGIMFK